MTSCSNELSVSGDHVGIGCRNSSSSISSKSLQTNIRSSRNPLAVLELEAMLLIPSIQVAQKEKLVSTLLKQGTSSYVLVVRPCSWFHEYCTFLAMHAIIEGSGISLTNFKCCTVVPGACTVLVQADIMLQNLPTQMVTFQVSNCN